MTRLDPGQSSSAPMALYVLDMSMEFAGPMPERYNHAGPEVTAAHREAVEAAQEVMRRHGFTITSTGHGSMRVGTYLPWEKVTTALDDEQRNG